MPRDTFLAKVRAATMAGRKHRVAVEELPDRTGYVGTANDLVESFAHEMIAVGGDRLHRG